MGRAVEGLQSDCASVVVAVRMVRRRVRGRGIVRIFIFKKGSGREETGRENRGEIEKLGKKND
jgi:hypothetical protein